jgi:hypothetical protein
VGGDTNTEPDNQEKHDKKSHLIDCAADCAGVL